jgi:hypothetical protein
MAFFLLALVFLLLKQPLIALIFVILGFTIGNSSRRR